MFIIIYQNTMLPDDYGSLRASVVVNQIYDQTRINCTFTSLSNDSYMFSYLDEINGYPNGAVSVLFFMFLRTVILTERSAG